MSAQRGDIFADHKMADLIRESRREHKMATIKPRPTRPKPNISQHNKSKVEQMNKTGYTVTKLADLVNQFGIPSSKGYKTKDYLEIVIKEIEDRDYRFVQFLQLVDVLYVIVQKVNHAQKKISHVNLPPEKFRPDEEIANHYQHPDPVINSQLQESIVKAPVMEVPEELEEVKKRDHLKKNLKKETLPWQKK